MRSLWDDVTRIFEETSCESFVAGLARFFFSPLL